MALVTSVRSMLDSNNEENAEQLSSLMKVFVNELDADDLMVMLYTLAIMAANPMDNQELTEFALGLTNQETK